MRLERSSNVPVQNIGEAVFESVLSPVTLKMYTPFSERLKTDSLQQEDDPRQEVRERDQSLQQQAVQRFRAFSRFILSGKVWLFARSLKTTFTDHL